MLTSAVRVICLLLLVLQAISLAESPDAPVLPADGFEAGWERAEQTRVFHKNDLYGHIDGGAELFLEFGFEKLLVQKYKNSPDEIDLEIYEMTEPAAALGIYLMKCGRETPLENIPARNTGNAYQTTVVKNNFFIQVNSFSGDEKFLPVMGKLARQTLKSIAESEPFTLFDLLPKENLVPGSELLLRGQYALQPIYTFGAGDIFQLKGEIFGISGSYRIDSVESFTLIIIPYPDNKAAASAFNHVLNNLDPYLEITDKLKDRFIFKDYRDRFGDIVLKNDILEIRFDLPVKPSVK
ncbi:MAG: hypothetical protein JXA92_08705 [candidate division Zixibacteria bacterium]|nr:hypothetical protein [candidate division Zixibacteria bacterium]